MEVFNFCARSLFERAQTFNQLFTTMYKYMYLLLFFFLFLAVINKNTLALITCAIPLTLDGIYIILGKEQKGK